MTPVGESAGAPRESAPDVAALDDPATDVHTPDVDGADGSVPAMAAGVPLGLPPQAAANLGRLVVLTAIVAVIGTLALLYFGHGLIALFGCFGLSLGVLNVVLVHRAAAKFSVSDDPHRKSRGAAGVFGRLAIVTVFALFAAVAFRPEGIGVFGGLVVFQFLMISMSLVPLWKEMRQA